MTTKHAPGSPLRNVWSQRRAKFFSLLPRSVAILSSGDVPKGLEGPFYANSNFYYLTGITEPSVVAILSTAAIEPQYILFWKEADAKEKVWSGPRLSLKEAKKAFGAHKVFPFHKLAEKLPQYLTGAERLYWNLGAEPHLDKMILQSREGLLRVKHLPRIVPTAIYDTAELMERLRLYKGEEELVAMRKAIEITALAYQEVFKTAKAGMNEYEIEALLYYQFRKHGALGTSFASIVASGINATVLHYSNNSRQIQPDDLLLVDSGARYDYYSADVTRTWPVSGKFTGAQRAMYEAVLAAQKAAIEEIRPGNEIHKFHDRAVRELAGRMLDLKLLSGSLDQIIEEKTFERFYMHRTGHFLGIDVHDLGGYFTQDKPRIFERGMVVTVEPGLYIGQNLPDIPDHLRGLGVRIEDDVLVTENGHEVLTGSIPKEIEELEEILKKRFC